MATYIFHAGKPRPSQNSPPCLRSESDKMKNLSDLSEFRFRWVNQ